MVLNKINKAFENNDYTKKLYSEITGGNEELEL